MTSKDDTRAVRVALGAFSEVRSVSHIVKPFERLTARLEAYEALCCKCRSNQGRPVDLPALPKRHK